MELIAKSLALPYRHSFVLPELTGIGSCSRSQT